MSRTPNELTTAIRQLCDETNGEITHIEARPRLEKMGFEIAPEPDRKSPEFAEWERLVTDYEVDYDDFANVKATAESVGYDADETALKRIAKEGRMRTAFRLERNTFNVAKYNWSKAKESGKPSVSRPAKGRNQKSQVAKGKKRQGRKPRTVEAAPAPSRGRKPQTEKINEISDMVALVQKHGGVQACHERVAELKAEIENAQYEIEAIERAVEVISAAVKAA